MSFLAQIVTATPTASPTPTASGDGYETARFWVSVIAAALTFLAILVALFRDQYHERRKRPKLSLEADGGKTWVPSGRNTRHVDPILLWIENASGKDTAEDVEVFATAYFGDGHGALHIVCENKPLMFEDPLSDGQQGRTTASVPSGFARQAWFGLAGSATTLGKLDKRDPLYPLPASGLRPAGQELAVALNPNLEAPAWLPVGQKVSVMLVVTGKNFDALYFEGAIESGFEDQDLGEERVVRMVGFWWAEPLRATKPDPDRRRTFR